MILAVVRNAAYVYMMLIYVGNQSNSQQHSNSCKVCVTSLTVEWLICQARGDLMSEDSLSF